MNMRAYIGWLIGSVLILTLWAPALATAANKASAAPIPSAKTPPGDGKILSPRDELVITLESFPDQHQEVKIRDDGYVYVSPVGDIKAATLTLSQFRKSLEGQLSKVLKHPGVLVGIKSLASRNVVVVGDVAHPGEFGVPEGSTLTQVLAMAGGPTDKLEDVEAVLYRGGKPTPVSLRLPDANTQTVEAGDVLYIHAATKTMVSVGGAVMVPGLQTLKHAKATVWESIVAAGGPKAEAAMRRVNLTRAGESTATLLDLSKGPASEQAGMLVSNGDRVTVPPQRVLVVGGGGQGTVAINGEENVLDVLVRAGVNTQRQLKKVVLMRAQELEKLVAAGKSVPTAPPPNVPVETLNLGDLRKGTAKGLVMVSDGDVLMVNPAGASGGGFATFMQFWYLLNSVPRI